jgi:hypothetical protein
MDRRFTIPEGAVKRSLTPAEQRLMQAAIASQRNRFRSLASRVLQASVLIIGILWLLTLLASHFSSQKLPWWIITLFWIIVGGAIALWSYIPERRRLAAGLAKFEKASGQCQAIAVHIRSDRVVEFEEVEDEGACYAFQLPDNRIRFVDGQDFYASARFPNSDFSLVHILSEEGELLECQITKHGRKLKPARTIPAKMKSSLNIPGHLEVIQGNVDDLERLLSCKGDSQE